MKDTGGFFDEYADAYEQVLDSFADGSVGWFARWVKKLNKRRGACLTSVAGMAPRLLAHLNAVSAVGTEVSLKFLDIARKNYSSAQIKYESI
jgi:hypothetical protein